MGKTERWKEQGWAYGIQVFNARGGGGGGRPSALDRLNVGDGQIALSTGMEPSYDGTVGKREQGDSDC